MLNVTARESSTGLEGNITITNDRNRLTKEEIDRMVADAERYHLDELKHRDCVLAKSALETFCLNIKENVQKEKDTVLQKCTEIMEWLDKGEPADKEEFEKKKKELEALLNGGVSKPETSTAGLNESLIDSPPEKKSKSAPLSVQNPKGNKRTKK